MKKSISTILLIIFAISAIFLWKNTGIGSIFVSAQEVTHKQIEQKIYCKATLDDDFAEDTVRVLLTNKASLNFKKYTAKDFPEIGILEIEDITEVVSGLLKKQIAAEESGTLRLSAFKDYEEFNNYGKFGTYNAFKQKQYEQYKELQPWIEKNMLMNAGDFKCSLKIILRQKSKEFVLEAIRLLEKRADVFAVNPDYLDSSGVNGNLSIEEFNAAHINDQWALDKINLPQALEFANGLITQTVNVGVLDSGIDASHLDLQGLVDETLSENFVNIPDYCRHGCKERGINNCKHACFSTCTNSCDNNCIHVCNDDYEYEDKGLSDPDGHGTHVAAVITSQNVGVVGVSPCVNLISLRVFEKIGRVRDSHIESAIYYAQANNIEILNYSGDLQDPTRNNLNIEQALIFFAGLFVTAAGNANENNYDTRPNGVKHFPSNYARYPYDRDSSIPDSSPNKFVISVGATDSDDDRWITFGGGSNYGDHTVFAPGADILSAYPTTKCPNDCGAGDGICHVDGYHFLSGTSMAAPYVTGVSALIKSVYPNIHPNDIKTAIASGSDFVPFLLYGDLEYVPRLNAYGALIRSSFDYDMSIDYSNPANSIVKVTSVNVAPIKSIKIPSKIPYFINMYNNNTTNILVTNIGCEILRNSATLESVIIPSNIDNIESNAFLGSTSLIIYAEATSLPDGWVSGWNSDHLYYFYSETCRNGYWHYNVDNEPELWSIFKYKVYGSGYEIAVQDGIELSGHIDIPSTYKNKDIIKIANNGFRDNYSGNGYTRTNGITSIALPNTITTIGSYAFSGVMCNEIFLPSSITSMGSNAFQNCSNLAIINFNAIVCSDLTVESNVFSGAGSNAPDGITVNIGNSVFKIPSYLFYNVTNLTTINFVNVSKVQYIRNYAFFGTMCNEVVLPSSVFSISDCALPSYTCVIWQGHYTYKGDEFIFYEGINDTIFNFTGLPFTRIGDGAFSRVIGTLSGIIISDNIMEIGEYAFADCINIDTIIIPSSVQYIGKRAFNGWGMHGCQTIYILGDNFYPMSWDDSYDAIIVYNPEYTPGLCFKPIMNGLAYEVSKGISLMEFKREIIIPDTFNGSLVVKIADYGFYRDEEIFYITTITIPDSVVIIGDYAFANQQGIIEIIINVRDYLVFYSYVGSYAFEGWGNNQTIYFIGNTSSVERNWSDYWSSDCNAYYNFYGIPLFGFNLSLDDYKDYVLMENSLGSELIIIKINKVILIHAVSKKRCDYRANLT